MKGDEGFLFGLVLATVIAYVFMHIMHNGWEKSAIKAGVATYVCDQATGDCNFKFKECK